MRLILMLSLLSLAGCSTTVPKYAVATGGSRADGVVEMSYEYGEFEKPVLDDDNTLAGAIERCKAWGFLSAVNGNIKLTPLGA